MTYYAEIRATVKRSGPPNLVPLSEVHKHSGFRSVFAYDEATAAMIRETRTTGGLRHVAVYSDTMFVDFDNCPGTELLEYLQAAGIQHEVWNSGGRSVHVHIALEPVYGSWVPKACKDWQKQFAPGSDTSFLHPAGVYRLPGTFHSKYPGRCKTLTYTKPGKPLQLERPALDLGLTFELEPQGTQEEFFRLLTQAKGEGHRQPHAWRLAVTGIEAGLSLQDVAEHVQWWNTKMCNPSHAPEIIQRQVESAWNRCQRKQTG